jgi:hypothetical protein
MILDTGRDISNIGAQIVAEIGKESVKSVSTIAGSSVNLILKSILDKLLKENPNLKPGKTNLYKLINSGKSLKMGDIDIDKLDFFAPLAKKFGISFAVIKDSGYRHLIYKEEDSERIKKVLEIAKFNKLKYDEKQLQKSKLKLNKTIKKQNTNISPDTKSKKTDTLSSLTENDESLNKQKFITPENIRTKQSVKNTIKKLRKIRSRVSDSKPIKTIEKTIKLGRDK